LIRQALGALHLFHRDTHYLIQEQKIQIVDEYTGRLMADRSWEKGLHQLIELKEGCPVTPQKETRARISYQRFFRRYLRLAGMTGTAKEVAGELQSIYGLNVVRLPTHQPLRRKRLANRIFATLDDKWAAVVEMVARHHRTGRPILVGTRSVEASEHLSRLLSDAGLAHEVLNARQDQAEAEIIARAGEGGRITVATNMAGRGTDIHLGAGMVECGGLLVVATECHEARRIDRQLLGRCGRQGDPGAAVMFLSLEDEIVEEHGNRILEKTTRLVLRWPPDWLGRWFGNLLFNRAQRCADHLHARMRHELLKFDERVSTSLAFTGRTE
jgi:preprotein translocase subunit SecA